jgi:hypothetical protein
VSRANPVPAERISTECYVDCIGGAVDLYGSKRGARDGNVPRAAERGLDIHNGAANMDSVEEFRSLWHDDGGQCSKDADGNRKLEERERTAREFLTYRRVTHRDSIREAGSISPTRIFPACSYRFA